MNWEGIVAIATCCGLVITISGFLFALGKLVARFEGLEARVCEDRDKNTKQHEDFYETRTYVESLKVEIANLVKTLDEVSGDVKEILRNLPKGA